MAQQQEQQEPLLGSVPVDMDEDGCDAAADEDDYLLEPSTAREVQSMSAPPGFVPQDPYYPIELDTFVGTSLNLSKAILGAGMMVIPKVFGMLGAVIGTTFLAIVGGLTWFTISGLVYAAEKTGKATYASVVRSCCGRASKWLLILAVFLNCYGLMTSYLVVFGDVLAGDPPQYDGIVHELLPGLDPADHWFMRRPALLGGMVLFVLAPLTIAVPLESLGAVNLLGVGSIVLFGATTVLLAGAAAAKGAAHAVPLRPNWSLLGDHPALIATAVVNILPILLNADVCHQAVFPLLPLLRPYSRKRMNRVAAVALGGCNVLYFVVAICCIIAFGSVLDADVLKHMTAEGLIPLVGAVPAILISYAVRLGYVVSLVGSFTLAMHPLRHCVLEVVLGHHYHTLHRAEESALFVPVTVVLLIGLLFTAVAVPGIWIVLSLVGSVAATLMGFIFPSLVVLAAMRKPKPAHTWRRVAAWVTIAIGAFLFVNGFTVFFHTAVT